jgi:outer membrane protein
MNKSRQLSLLHVLALLPLSGVSLAMAADPAVSATESSDAWHYSVGFGVMNAPVYAGSSQTRFKALPLVGASNGRFFAGAANIGVAVPLGVGAYLLQSEHVNAGVALGYDIYSPRKQSDAEARLHGLGDIDRAAHITVFSRYSNDGFSLSGAVISSSMGQGMQVKLGADTAFRLNSRMILNSGPSLTWSNSRANQTFYGISAAQSASSGLSQYSPAAGISDITMNLGLTYLLTPGWAVSVRVGAGVLPGNISNSPIVEKTFSNSYTLLTNYRF